MHLQLRACDDDFEAFYRSRSDHLRSTAYLLCGDWHFAEDLTQIAFAKLYRSWGRIERHDVMDQYARKVLLNAFLDERRRPWRREYPTEPTNIELDAIVHDEYSHEDRSVLQGALMRLPERRRAVLVLRYWADMSVEQVAELLGCATGTVKSQSARGVAQLRDQLTDLGSGFRP